MSRRVMGDLWLGHFTADLASGALPAVLVFLKPLLHLSYTKTGAVVLAATITSALAQPLFGRWSDRHVMTWLLPVGIAAAAIGIAFAPSMHSYPLVLLLVSISGLGVGAFHPEAMKIARYASGERRASGIAVFQTGGNLGIALGPLIAGAALTLVGAVGGLVLLVPGAAVTLLLVLHFAALARVRRAGVAETRRLAEPDRPGPFKLLLATIGLRSVSYYGLFTFVPLWEVAHGHSKGFGTALLSLVLFAGAFGTLCMGPLADRYPHRILLAATLSVTPVFVLFFVLGSGTVSAIAIVLAGATTVSSFGLTTVMGQEYLPSRIALASGLTVGFAMGLGGVAVVMLGVVADSVDLRAALLCTAVAPALGALISLFLPGEPRRVSRVDQVALVGD
jgi:FSR family fosmidomycin resistance protein-like MFS transporter